MMLMLNSCTELAAILMSSGGFVASQNVYSKTYGGIDLITIIKTKKNIREHAKELLKPR